MKKLLTLVLLILVVNTVFAQYQWEKVLGVKGGYGADSTITSVVENEKSTGNTKVILRTPSDSTFLNQNPDTSELFSTNPFVVRPPFVVENNLQIKSGSPGSGKVLTSDGSGNVSWTNLAGGSTILFYSLTYAQAEDSIALGSLIKGAYYAITDKNVILVADNDTVFSLYGTYIRSGTEFNACLYDFSEDLVIYEETKNNDKVGASSLALTYGIVDTDPRTVYKFSDPLVIGNYVVDGTFNNSTSTGQIYFNDVIKGGIVSLTGDGNFVKSSILGVVTATGFTGDVTAINVGPSVELDISGSSGTFINSIFDQTTTADFTGFTGTASNLNVLASDLTVSNAASLTGLCIANSTATISGTPSLNRAKINSGSTIVISGNPSLNDITVSGTKIVASGGTAVRSIILGDSLVIGGTANFSNSYLGQDADAILLDSSNAPYTTIAPTGRLDLSGGVQAGRSYIGPDCILTGSDEAIAFAVNLKAGELIAKDKSDVTGIYLYTGANVLAEDSAFLEGLIVRNVSDVQVSGGAIVSPGEIENQSLVRITGNGNYGNAKYHGITLFGSDTVDLQDVRLEYANVRVDSAANISQSYVYLNGRGGPVLYYKNDQRNQYVTTERSTKEETVYIQTDTLNFRHDSLYHWAGHLHVTVDDTINTITGLEAAPKYFRLYANTGTKLVLEKSTATNIKFPKSFSKIVAEGNLNEFIELWHDGVNVHVMSSSFATIDDNKAWGEMGFGDSTSTQALTQNVWHVVTNPNEDLWKKSVVDTHAVTYTNDSIVIQKEGTYALNLQLSVDGSTNSVIRLGIYVNGALACTCTGYQELANNQIVQINYINIDRLSAGDVVQPVITNTANDDDVDAIAGKLTIHKID